MGAGHRQILDVLPEQVEFDAHHVVEQVLVPVDLAHVEVEPL